ncbi:hypothetical protein ACIQVR_39465 [Streptomyces xanthochromogenes]|uniref:hypothetical protein n=1 Tax=Streptomyces xanthochromogenes TaxID=67384 RepID=UPI0037FE8A9F
MPDQLEIPCGFAVLTQLHAAHDWQPQRGMDPVRCRGYGVTPGSPARVSQGSGGTCDASIHGAFGPLGPCILRHQHDDPVHKDADGTTWIRLAAAPDPLARFRALADQYAAEAAEAARNATASTGDTRLAQQGIAAGWQHAEFLLRHTIDDLDNSPTSDGGNHA